jgi:hypothetical protein
MRLLANENFPGEAVEALRARGHDVLWVRTDFPGSPDREVLARALAETRVLITFDKDFGELALRSKPRVATGIVLYLLNHPRMLLRSPSECSRAGPIGQSISRLSRKLGSG